jgi:hypothetical protein
MLHCYVQLWRHDGLWRPSTGKLHNRTDELEYRTVFLLVNHMNMSPSGGLDSFGPIGKVYLR